jgi:hypothetical protein
MLRQVAANLLGYIEKNICPGITLERLMREGQTEHPNVVAV